MAQDTLLAQFLVSLYEIFTASYNLRVYPTFTRNKKYFKRFYFFLLDTSQSNLCPSATLLMWFKENSRKYVSNDVSHVDSWFKVTDIEKSCISHGGERINPPPPVYRIIPGRHWQLLIKMESIRKLSYQWTKTLYQNNLKYIAFLFTLFKSYRRN